MSSYCSKRMLSWPRGRGHEGDELLHLPKALGAV